MARPREPLSRERVVTVAMRLADEGGIDHLTMRGLGSALGVEAMSLYNHVANKRDLVSALVDEVVGEYELPASGTEWKGSLRSAGISANRTLMRHPWVPGLLLAGRTMPGFHWMAWSDAVLSRLRTAGFSPESAHHAFHTLEGYIDGQSLRQVNFRFQVDDIDAIASDFMARFARDQYPFLVEHIEGHLGNRFTKSGFEFGLDLILDGLERILADPLINRPGRRPRR